MNPTRTVIWLTADIVFGLIHVIIFTAKIVVFDSAHRENRKSVWMPFLGTGVLFAYTITLLATHMGQLAQALVSADHTTPDQKLMAALTTGLGILLLIICTALYTLSSNDIINEIDLGFTSERRNSRRVGLTSVVISLVGLAVSFFAFYLACIIGARNL